LVHRGLQQRAQVDAAERSNVSYFIEIVLQPFCQGLVKIRLADSNAARSYLFGVADDDSIAIACACRLLGRGQV
jgi:hypothetical protein